VTGRRCLVLGGARSGKSHWAEQRLAAQPVRYLATGYPADDPDWSERVAAHRARRPSHWNTVESLDLATELQREDERPVLVDCLTLWLTRRLDQVPTWTQSAAAASADLEPDIAALVAALAAARCDVVLVSNEVGSGIVPANPAGRVFADLLGTLNRRVAEQCQEVVLMVAGIPVAVKQPDHTPGGSHR
jgi:adenosylcobinamide kinase/adenosylcobinamide-phosphate guanylyltransferase